MQPLSPNDPREIGPYRILAPLGQGSMGRVYLGHGSDGMLVAVKLIRDQLVDDEGFRSRFSREVAASQQVSGVYTAAVVDADADAVTPWLASAFLLGPTLKDAVSTGPLPEATVLRVAAGLASGLAAIHRARLVHRDLKPGNVILASDGPRVIDFGIARAVDGHAGPDLTRTGGILGTPAFMSPEQARSLPLQASSDVFSLGSVLVMASTGASPFETRDTLGTLNNVVRAEPDLTAVPGSVRPIVERCLAPEPGDRPTPAEVLAMIGPVAPALSPWPEAVTALIDRHRSELERIIDDAGADPTIIDTAADPPSEPEPDTSFAGTTRLDTGPTMVSDTPPSPATEDRYEDGADPNVDLASSLSSLIGGGEASAASLADLLSEHLTALVEAVVAAAGTLDLTAARELAAALRLPSVAADHRIDQAADAALDRLPFPHPGLAELGAALAARAVDHHERGTDTVKLAVDYDFLGLCLGAQEKSFEALAASARAVALYEELAAGDRAAHLPGLATVVRNHASHLHDALRWKKALAASARAVALYEELAAGDRAAHLPGLAMAVKNHANRLVSDSLWSMLPLRPWKKAMTGRRREALAASARAVALYEELAAGDRAAHLPGLALAVRNHSSHLGEAGRREEALPEFERAVALYEELAAGDRAAHLPGLAEYLWRAARFRWVQGFDRATAAAFCDRAIAYYRELAGLDPTAFADALARVETLRRKLTENRPKRLWVLGVLLFLQALPLSALLYSAFEVEATSGLNAARFLVLAAIVLLWVRRRWAWWTLVAIQGVAVPLIVTLPLLDELGTVG